MVSAGWGIKPYSVKTWCKTVVEKTLTYAASIWGHNLNTRGKEVLTTYQRHFLLAIVKAYETTSNAAFQVLAGLIPIHLQVKKEAVYGTISRLREAVNIHGKQFLMPTMTRKSIYGKHTQLKQQNQD